MTNLTGQTIGRYHIIEQLGSGGMATVYKAYDNRLEREVAIKVIRKDSIGSQYAGEILKRFEREAKMLARLSHPNIVNVHDYGDHEGSPYLVMQCIQGGTMKNKTGRPMPYAEAARLLTPIAQALDYAHKRNLVHRDVKPANVLITESGEPMLTDFGIAKILEAGDQTAALTGTGVGIGTPEYMAPEQAMGLEIDHRTDIYALGIMFYELITGRRPFQADTPMAVVVKHINDPLPRPRTFIANLPESVEQVVFKALAKKPEERYQSMSDFADALEKLAHSAPTAHEAQINPDEIPTWLQTPEGQFTPPPAKKKGSWLPWVIGIGALVLIGVCFLLVTVMGGFTLLAAVSGTATPTTGFTVSEQIDTVQPPTSEPATLTHQPTLPPTQMSVISFEAGTNASYSNLTDCVSNHPNLNMRDLVGMNTNYCDTFDDVSTYDTGSDEVAQGYYSYSIVDGRYLVDIEAYESFIYYYYWPPGDEGQNVNFALSIDGFRTSDSTQNAGYGLIFRFDKESHDFYLVEIADDWQTYVVLIRQDSTWTQLIEHTYTPAINPNGWNMISVDTFEPGLYNVYINGELVTSFEDDRLTEGGLGFAAEVYEGGDTATFNFDNLLYLSQP